jgi:hypothetical protein
MRRLVLSLLAVLLTGLLMSGIVSAGPPAAASEPWVTGQSLMEQLSEAHGYRWSEVVFTDGSRGMWSVASDEEAHRLLQGGMAASGGIIVIAEPTDAPASAAVLASPLAGGGFGVPQVDEVVSILAPDALPWADAAFMRGQSLAATGSSIDESFHVPAGELRVTGGADQAVVQLLLIPGPPRGSDTGTSRDEDGHLTFGDGSYRVGLDVSPGTYRVRQPAGRCTWQRFDDPSPDAPAVATRSASGYAVVTILPTDARFVASGCGTWSDDLSAVLLPGQAIPDGVFIVGTDLEPGVYENGGGPQCFWARLRDFSDPSDAVQADLGRQRFSVTIEPSGAGFLSDGCVAWVRT